jgi:hypothetical protein
MRSGAGGRTGRQERQQQKKSVSEGDTPYKLMGRVSAATGAGRTAVWRETGLVFVAGVGVERLVLRLESGRSRRREREQEKDVPALALRQGKTKRPTLTRGGSGAKEWSRRDP